jgi:hypothetical protein
MSILKTISPKLAVEETEISPLSSDEDEAGDDYLDEGVRTLATITSQPKFINDVQTIKPKPALAKSNYTDPNIYLKLDPIKSIQSRLARSINYEHVIITRFSYRFRKDTPVGGLFDEKRLLRRFQLFESFCLPSVLSQINPNFYWVIIVDEELPTHYLDILWKAIAAFYSSSLYANRGPRQIFVHRWDYSSTLAHIDWLQKLIPLTKKYLITTRFDDDDSLSRDFTNQVADSLLGKSLGKTSLTGSITGFKLITFSNGYYWYHQPNLTYGIFKATNRPWIAIGLTLITEREKYPMTVYFGNHTKLTQYIRNWKQHALLRGYIEANHDEYDVKHAADRYVVIRKNNPVYIRSVHDHNLQQNERNDFINLSKSASNENSTTLKKASIHSLNIITQYFTINQSCLENVNSQNFLEKKFDQKPAYWGPAKPTPSI